MWLAARVRRRFAGPGTRPCGGLQRSTSSSARATTGGASGGEVRPERPRRRCRCASCSARRAAVGRVLLDAWSQREFSGARARDELGRRSGGGSAAAGTRSCGKGPSARTTDGSRSSTGSRSSRTGSQRPYFLTRVGLLLEGALESGRATDAACAAPEIVHRRSWSPLCSASPRR
jgi:hypothetical protein